jgi:tmRNA-binding protein
MHAPSGENEYSLIERIEAEIHLAGSEINDLSTFVTIPDRLTRLENAAARLINMTLAAKMVLGAGADASTRGGRPGAVTGADATDRDRGS